MAGFEEFKKALWALSALDASAEIDEETINKFVSGQDVQLEFSRLYSKSHKLIAEARIKLDDIELLSSTLRDIEVYVIAYRSCHINHFVIAFL